jgi:hypothetical protein
MKICVRDKEKLSLRFFGHQQFARLVGHLRAERHVGYGLNDGAPAGWYIGGVGVVVTLMPHRPAASWEGEAASNRQWAPRP